jgi:hypothetical protein
MSKSQLNEPVGLHMAYRTVIYGHIMHARLRFRLENDAISVFRQTFICLSPFLFTLGGRR